MMKRFIARSLDSADEWLGELRSFHDYGAYQRVIIVAKGSRLDVFFGCCCDYRWVFLPELEKGCMQADFNDLFWNTERLSHIIGSTDASSVVFGIQAAVQLMEGDDSRVI